MDTLNNLPDELKYELIKYSSTYQDKKLLDDIYEFNQSYQLIIQLYEQYVNELGYQDDIKDRELYAWLSNNICVLIQDKTGLHGFINGLNQEFIEIMKTRSYIFRIFENKIKEFFLVNPNNNNTIEYAKKECKYLWSLLTIEERKKMIEEIQQNI